MKLKKKEVLEKWNLNLRPETTDLNTFLENDYEVCNYKSTDNWLDVGGNVGSFGLKYYPLVNTIVSVEADEDNCNYMKQNYELNNVPNIVSIRAAVVGDNSDTIDFYPCSPKSPSMNSPLPIKGRIAVTVPAINIDKLIHDFKINKIKMDIEGGEWDVLLGIQDWTPIQEIIFEYHKSFLKDKDDSKAEHILNILRENGFDTINLKPLNFYGQHRLTIIHACK
tara:strand:- start:1008 stop:1676 length:669 start_codon:yes stop_codon:yes gene_type:complete